MPVTSTTINASGTTFNVYQFSGTVVDTDLINNPTSSSSFTGAWASIRDANSGTFFVDRAIYIDNTANLTGLRGNYNIVCRFTTTLAGVAFSTLGFILHSGRTKANTALQNFTIMQPSGNLQDSRAWFVASWNGSIATALSALGGGNGTDGLDLNGSSYFYNTPQGDNTGSGRNLCEIGFGNLTNAVIGAQRYTLFNVQPCIGFATVLKGVAFNKCAGFPQADGTANAPGISQVIYRSSLDNNATQAALRPFNRTNQCFVNSTITYNGGSTGTNSICEAYPDSASFGKNIVILGNWQDQNWFGTTKTFIVANSWTTTNQFVGGVIKNLKFINPATGAALVGATIKAYDSRSTTASAQSSFRDDVTTSNFTTLYPLFLDTSTTPVTDANGQIRLVHIGAIATGGTNGGIFPVGVNVPLTRYTGQKYTFQQYGRLVYVGTPDMTFGDDDLSAYAPVVIAAQSFITRTQAQVNAATSIANIEQLGEEIHNIAVGLTGAVSYNADYSGNLYQINGLIVNTLFTNITINSLAVSKITYTSASDSLTIKDVTALIATANLNALTTTGTITLSSQATASGNYVLLSAGTINLGSPTGTTVYQSLTATTYTNLPTTGIFLGPGGAFNGGSYTINMTGSLQAMGGTSSAAQTYNIGTGQSITFSGTSLGNTITIGTPDSSVYTLTLTNCSLVSNLTINKTGSGTVNALVTGLTLNGFTITYGSGVTAIASFAAILLNVTSSNTLRVGRLWIAGVERANAFTYTYNASGYLVATVTLGVPPATNISAVFFVDGFDPVATGTVNSNVTNVQLAPTSIDAGLLNFGVPLSTEDQDIITRSSVTFTAGTPNIVTCNLPSSSYTVTPNEYTSPSVLVAKLIVRRVQELASGSSYHQAMSDGTIAARHILWTQTGYQVQNGPNLAGEIIRFTLQKSAANTATILFLDLYVNDTAGIYFPRLSTYLYATNTTDVSRTVGLYYVSPGAILNLTAADQQALANYAVTGIVGTTVTPGPLRDVASGVAKASLLIPYTPNIAG